MRTGAGQDYKSHILQLMSLSDWAKQQECQYLTMVNIHNVLHITSHTKHTWTYRTRLKGIGLEEILLIIENPLPENIHMLCQYYQELESIYVKVTDGTHLFCVPKSCRKDTETEKASAMNNAFENDKFEISSPLTLAIFLQ